MNMDDKNRLFENQIDLNTLTLSLYDDDAGAISTFIGTTRKSNGNYKIKHLVYESYVQMANKQILDLEVRIRSKFKVLKVVIAHRLGIVGLQEPSVFIGISSARRKDSLEACSYAIEELKKKVTIWKKEVTQDDETLWIANDTPLSY